MYTSKEQLIDCENAWREAHAEEYRRIEEAQEAERMLAETQKVVDRQKEFFDHLSEVSGIKF